jgi:NAD(P)-dependent dehydrogenase (short-subunit alcohol dehydrogenase family)
MPTVLLTGANRGLGLEFARRYASAGWRVHACCRHPLDAAELNELAARALSTAGWGPIDLHALDVRDFSRTAALASELQNDAIDLLLANAGTYGPSKMFLGQIDYSAWAEVLAVNTLAPLRLVECFVEHVARSERKLIACVSSAMGSIGGNTGGRHYLYRSSKAGLNSVVRSLAVDLKPRGIVVVSLHPGWVRTEMGGPGADLSPEESVRGMIAVLERLGPADSGRFLSYDGAEVPW